MYMTFKCLNTRQVQEHDTATQSRVRHSATDNGDEAREQEQSTAQALAGRRRVSQSHVLPCLAQSRPVRRRQDSRYVFAARGAHLQKRQRRARCRDEAHPRAKRPEQD